MTFPSRLEIHKALAVPAAQPYRTGQNHRQPALAVVTAIIGAVRIAAGCKTGRSGAYLTEGHSLAGRHIFVPPGELGLSAWA